NLDIGYGWTKAKYKGRVFCQPSVLGDIKPLHDENKKDGYLIYGEHFVGELAVRHSDIKYHSLKESKASTWTTEVLIKTALAYLRSDGTRIVSGLPVDFYFSQKDEFEKMLLSLNNQYVKLDVLGEGT